MYIVGGYLGYQWADFHCGFEMTFLCEHNVSGGHEPWRRRRQMKKVQWCFDLVDCRDIVDYSLVACPVTEMAQ